MEKYFNQLYLSSRAQMTRVYITQATNLRHPNYHDHFTAPKLPRPTYATPLGIDGHILDMIIFFAGLISLRIGIVCSFTVIVLDFSSSVSSVSLLERNTQARLADLCLRGRGTHNG